MVELLIRRARRRLIVNESLGQLAFAAAVAAGGVAVILLAGTRFLEWWTLAIFAGLGIAIGVIRAWKASPDDYTTAIRIDRQAHLHDVLSTAYYYSGHASEYPESRDLVRAQAETAARSVALESAVPFTFPRALYALAALALLATAILAVRLIVRRSLDLRAPITEVLFEDLAAKQAIKKKEAGNALDRKRLETAESLLAKLGLAPNPDEQKQDTAALDKAIDQALDAAASPIDKGQKGEQGKPREGKTANGAEKSPNGDPLDGKPSDNADQSAGNKPPSGQDGAPGDKGSSKNGNGENSSLMSKLKDAVSNMFSKPKQDNSTARQNQQQGQMAKSDKANGEKGSNGKNQDQGQAQADAQDGEPNSDSQDGQQAQGKSGAKSAQSSAQAGSGVGSQDGAKDLKAAEQLKAMGKISEILGKRASTVTGETTIEVQSGNQQLRTAYSNSTAKHGESDSDLNRDEIPVALEPYIQQYFEQVRKAAPAPAKKQ
ncbi:MAG: hypothetical protein KGN84_19025 [Acidobacteriota bacterium]|nr:hypothetical protein [Acidobacteriota bacterium]